MPEPLLVLGLLSAGYFALKRRKDPGELSPYDELKQEYRRVRDAARYSRRTLRIFKKRLDIYGKTFKSRGDKFLPIASQLFAEEFTKKKLPKRSSGEAELKRFRKWLDQYKDKVENLHRTLPLFYDTVFQMYQKFEKSVPLPSQCKSHELPVPLIERVGNPGKFVEEILQPINHPDVVSAGLFSKLREQVKYVESIHGRPSKFEGRPQAMIDAYLKELHMDHLLDGTVPFTIPLERQLEHSMLAAGCLHPDTKIYDPIARTNYTIEQRFKSGDFFNVFALTKDGSITIATAWPPTRFTRQPMIRLTDGYNAISVTPEHRVWNGVSYVRASQLREYGAFHLPTISDGDLEALREDVLRTDGDFRAGCHPLPRLYDRRPPTASDTCRASSPSQAGAPGRTYYDDCAQRDGKGNEQVYTRFYQPRVRPSMSRAIDPASCTLSRESLCLAQEDTFVLYDRTYACAAVSPTATNHLYKAERDDQPSSCSTCSNSYGDYTTWHTEPGTDAVYYDFYVPIYNNYLAAGLFHHNSRYGKSQLIGWLIASHLQSDDPPGIIVVDSTGDFLEKISRLEVFSPTGRLAGKLLVIDPADSPQLNMFDVSRFDGKGYSSEDMEQVEAATLKLFDYVFASIGSDLTSQQGTGFNFLVRLLLTIPGSTLTTLKEILELPATKYDQVPAPIRNAISKLDPNTQTFFKNHFFTPTMFTTRLGVARRLYNLLQIPTFERMFSGANRIDFFKAMNNGLIIVVNTSANRLQDASPLFGRYIIARVMSAAFERTVIKDINQRRPCLLFVDEAQEYFDKSIDTMLTQIGKYRLGLFIAFQYFDQLDDKLRKSVLGNTTVKFAGGGLGATEAHMIAKELRVDDKLVMSLKKDSSKKPHWAQFATYINFVTDRALSITVPFYALENMPKMTDAEHKELLTRNRERVAGKPEAPKQEKKAPEPPPKSTPEPDDKPLEDFE